MKKMNVVRKITCFFLIFSLCIFTYSFNVKASDFNTNLYSDQNLTDGPTVVFQLSADNGYSDSFVIQSNYGATAVTCRLSGGVGGVQRMYSVLIFWTGTNSVQAIRANTLTIKNANILQPQTPYFSRGFSIDGLSSNSGCRTIGQVYIPEGVNTVNVRTTGLQAFFYDRDWWISTGELNGPIHL